MPKRILKGVVVSNKADKTITLSAKGSKINVQDVLLIFVNDILQIPGKAYKFNGGSLLRFTEAPKEGDTCKIMFYKGTATVDVNDVEVLETVKPGDDIIIGWDPGVEGQLYYCLLYTSPSPRDRTRSRMPSSA